MESGIYSTPRRPSAVVYKPHIAEGFLFFRQEIWIWVALFLFSYSPLFEQKIAVFLWLVRQNGEAFPIFCLGLALILASGEYFWSNQRLLGRILIVWFGLSSWTFGTNESRRSQRRLFLCEKMANERTVFALFWPLLFENSPRFFCELLYIQIQKQ